MLLKHYIFTVADGRADVRRTWVQIASVVLLNFDRAVRPCFHGLRSNQCFQTLYFVNVVNICSHLLEDCDIQL